jgi:hypothetical protein
MQGNVPAVIERHAPGDASKEGSFIREVPPYTISVELQESLLNSVLSVMGIEHQGECNAEDEARLALNQIREVFFFVRVQ